MYNMKNFTDRQDTKDFTVNYLMCFYLKFKRTKGREHKRKQRTAKIHKENIEQNHLQQTLKH